VKTSTGERLLFGKRILITRMAEQAAALAEPLAALGAEPLLCPTVEIIPPENFNELDAALAELTNFDYLILTSANAVSAFFTRLRSHGLDTQALASLRIVAVGPKTAEAIAAEGFIADLIPADYRAEGVVELLREQVIGKRLLYPKAALARDLIPAALTAAGGEVVNPVAYASAPPADAADNLRQTLAGRLDLLTFTASSTVQNFVDLLDAEQLTSARRIPVASIGPLTSETARKLGFRVLIEPTDSTLENMIEAIEKYFSKTRDAKHGVR
jgi:uroporphyrinogen III methyltransferase/synthase